ncbi:hypothetical protein [Streptomyces luteireticuli]|uniref:hypothetical protein n=1 Tax=Streptomyces luteireticuli TaxID=173858 RepID=UPI003557416F
MLAGEQYEEELDYLTQYAKTTPVYFTPVRDAAETVAGKGSTEAQIQAVTLKLVDDLLDRGVQIGDMSPLEGEAVIPWNLSREQTLRKVAEGMQKYKDPLDFIYICWFSAPAE